MKFLENIKNLEQLVAILKLYEIKELIFIHYIKHLNLNNPTYVASECFT